MKTISAIAISLIVTGAASVPRALAQKVKTNRQVVVAHSGSYLGVGAIDIDDERAKALNLKELRGVEIKSVDSDSPAAKAGLKEGDVVLEFNGQRVEGSEQFARLVHETPAGRQVRLAISRGGASQNLTATIATRPGVYSVRSNGDTWAFTVPPVPPIPPMPTFDMPQIMTNWHSGTLGVDTETLTAQLAEFFGVKEGVLVRAVTKNSAAEKAGIKAGDVIVKVDDAKVASPRDLTAALRSLRSKRTFPVVVVRKQQETTLSVTIEERHGSRMPAPSVARRTLYC